MAHQALQKISEHHPRDGTFVNHEAELTPGALIAEIPLRPARPAMTSTIGACPHNAPVAPAW